jgi:hypothetical protein
LNEFIKHKLFDEIHKFKSKNIRLIAGDLAPEVQGIRMSYEELPNDFYEVFKNDDSL